MIIRAFLVLWVISTGFGVVLAIFNGLDNDLAIYGCGIWSSFPSLPGRDRQSECLSQFKPEWFICGQTRLLIPDIFHSGESCYETTSEQNSTFEKSHFNGVHTFCKLDCWNIDQFKYSGRTF